MMNNRHSTQFVKKRSDATHGWERLQLKRLLWAVALFLTVFLGKRIYPEKMLLVGEEVLDVLSRSTDFEAVFAQLGESLARTGGPLEGIETFCVEVFGVKAVQAEQTVSFQPELPTAKAGLLDQETQSLFPVSADTPEQQSILMSCEETEESVPAVGAVLTVGEEPEQPLPDGYTVDELSFGALETVTPVLGQLNSAYGYRNHPVSGTYSFHGGVDINGSTGDSIVAFADGTVEYVGEDSSYGLYLQLDHGNGIRSFYAHCQSVCVQQGQAVKAGETVARIGATGTATGPHLHLELKCGQVRVDPAYYVDFL